VAFGLGARWAANCAGVTVGQGALECLRHEVGGKVQVVEHIDARAVVTLRAKSIDVAGRLARRAPRLHRKSTSLSPYRVRSSTWPAARSRS
jgi:hypothetical protein